MAKKSVWARQVKREKLVGKYADLRAELKKKVLDASLPRAERVAAQTRLQKLPRDASPVRLRTRCSFSGRPRAVYRHFGLARNKLREVAMSGAVPGLTKASW